jgi:hypothetical protein
VLRLCGLLPKIALNVSFRDIEEGVDYYAALLPCSVEAVELEFHTWQILCRGMDIPPYDCISALRMCAKIFYLAIHSLLHVYFRNPSSVNSNSGT